MKRRIISLDEFISEAAKSGLLLFENLSGIQNYFNSLNYKTDMPRPSTLYVSKHNRAGDESFTFMDEPNHPAGRYYIFMESKIITSSESLADPRAAYLTTSARLVKTKKVKTVEYFDDMKKVSAAIEKHMNKVAKI